MASGYTANYGLCQWQGSDKFLREEFNQDNEKIDAALKAADGKADRALSGLETADYNIYNLILQNEYEGKSTDWKKALLFDGFWDSRGISQKSDTLVLGDGCIGMNGVGHTPSGMRGASSSRVLNSIMSIREILCAGRQNRSPEGVCTSMISEKQPYSTAMRSSE